MFDGKHHAKSKILQGLFEDLMPLVLAEVFPDDIHSSEISTGHYS